MSNRGCIVYVLGEFFGVLALVTLIFLLTHLPMFGSYWPMPR